MIIHLATGSSDGVEMSIIAANIAKREFHGLVSYWYFNSKDKMDRLRKYMPKARLIMADSGAYSAYTQGAEIDIARYADWLIQYQDVFSVMVSLDVKVSWRQGQENFLYLRGRGLDVLPVFHISEPGGLLREMCQEFDYVGLGGVGRLPSDGVLISNLIECFKVGQEYGSRFHFFGMTRIKVLMSFDWRSVDSTSWMQGGIYGITPRYDAFKGLKSCKTAHDKRHYIEQLQKRYSGLKQWQDEYKPKEYQLQEVAGALAYIELEQRLTERHSND